VKLSDDTLDKTGHNERQQKKTIGNETVLSVTDDCLHDTHFLFLFLAMESCHRVLRCRPIVLNMNCGTP